MTFRATAPAEQALASSAPGSIEDAFKAVGMAAFDTARVNFYARNDGTAGRVALVDNILAGMRTVGKFGWKAQVPTLQQFSGDAYLNEMGITSPDFPNENCPSGNCAELRFNPRPGLNDGGEDVDALANFMRFLAAPPRGARLPLGIVDRFEVADRPIG